MKYKTKLSAEPSLIFPLILLFWGNSIQEIFLFLSAVALHEAGHLLCLIAFGHRPKAIRFSLVGANMEAECALLAYRKEIFLFLSGPFFNFLGCVASFFLIRMEFREEFLFFFFCNAILGLFNLLPLPGLDGYGAIFSALCLLLEMDSALRILRAISRAFLLITFFASIFLLANKQNPSLLIFLFYLVLKETKNEKTATK